MRHNYFSCVTGSLDSGRRLLECCSVQDPFPLPATWCSFSLRFRSPTGCCPRDPHRALTTVAKGRGLRLGSQTKYSRGRVLRAHAAIFQLSRGFAFPEVQEDLPRSRRRHVWGLCGEGVSQPGERVSAEDFPLLRPVPGPWGFSDLRLALPLRPGAGRAQRRGCSPARALDSWGGPLPASPPPLWVTAAVIPVVCSCRGQQRKPHRRQPSRQQTSPPLPLVSPESFIGYEVPFFLQNSRSGRDLRGPPCLPPFVDENTNAPERGNHLPRFILSLVGRAKTRI